MTEDFTALETEQAVLGWFMMNPEQGVLAAMKLDAACFAHPLHAVMFEKLREIHAVGGTVNPITLQAKIDKNPEFMAINQPDYVKRLTSVAAFGPELPDYFALLIDLKTRRRLEAGCNEALTALRGGVPAEEVALMLEEAKLEATARSAVMKTEKQVMAELWQDVTEQREPIRTGLPRLDEAMDGGMFPRRAYGVLARKKMGKTVLASTIAKNVADAGHPVLFIAAEMGDKEIQERVACRVMDCYGNAFRSDYRNSKQFADKFAEAVAKSSDNLIYTKAPGIRFDALRQLITAAIVRHKISGFVLDYWQLVGGKNGRTSEREHLDTVAQWLADFARENNLWCLVMGQENQDGNSRGGEGIRLAFDMVFSLQGNEEEPERWMEMKDTRYTKWRDVGSEAMPALFINEKGPFMDQITRSGERFSTMEAQ